MSTIGIAIPGSVFSARSERFYTQVLHGLEDVAVARGHAVLSHVTRSPLEEIEVMRHWAARSLVDVVVLKDLREQDPRPAAAAAAGLAVLVIGDVRQFRTGGLSGVVVDNAATMEQLLADLRALGHEAIAHVSGPPELLHTRWRREAYDAVVAREGLPALSAVGDYTADSGAEATRALLDGPVRPTAVVYDNDAMAIAGYDTAVAAGLAVPGDLSVVAWDDSPACQTHAPPLAVVDRSPHRIGEEIAITALALLEDPGTPARRRQDTARLDPRGSVQAPGSPLLPADARLPAVGRVMGTPPR